MEINNSQITSLAREYAEQSNNPRHFTHVAALEAEDVIEWLCDRFCLVEKVQLIAHYNMAKANIKPRYLEACQYEVGATEVLESLFPEIAKEVEE